MTLGLPASHAARRVACPGSWTLENKVPKDESDFTREGKAAHWVATELLEEGEVVAVNTYTPDGHLVTQEMIDGALLLLDDVKSVNPIVADWVVENYLTMPDIHPLLTGTPDIFTFVWDDKGTLLAVYIWDYKFGHAYVDANKNWQLIAYAAGVVQHLRDAKIQVTSNIKFHLRVVQPRNYQGDPIREWVTTYKELLNIWFYELAKSEKLATQPDAVCIPSPECNYCRAKHICTALQNASFRSIDYMQQNHSEELNPKALSMELQLLQKSKKLIEARLDGLETVAMSKLEKGENVPYYEIGYTNGREVWAKDLQEVKILGELYNIELTKPIELVTPNQAVDKGLPKSIKNMYTRKQPGNKKLNFVEEEKLQQIFANKP